VEHRTSAFVGWLQRVYGRVLARILPRGRVAFAAVAVLTAVGLLTVRSLDRSLLPSFKEPNLVIHLSSPPGTSQPEMTRISGRITRELRSSPGFVASRATSAAPCWENGPAACIPPSSGWG